MYIDEVTEREKLLAKILGLMCVVCSVVAGEDFKQIVTIVWLPLLCVLGIHYRVQMVVPEGYKASFMTRMEPEFLQKWIYMLIFWGILIVYTGISIWLASVRVIDAISAV